MKVSQLDGPRQENLRIYVRETFDLDRQSVRETKDRILGYIFGLNGGGLVAGMAYVAQKNRTVGNGVKVAIFLFFIGLLAAVLRAAMDYHSCEASSATLRDNVKKLYTNQIETEAFLASRELPRPPQWPFYGLGYVSGVCFFVGLLCGILTTVL